MGLYTTALLRIIRILNDNGVKGKSLCMVGRQEIQINPDSFKSILNKMGIGFDYDEWDVLVKENRMHYDSYRFFKMLGLGEVHAIDYRDEDGADIIYDLNKPIPEELHGRFDYIIDSGSMEHIFDNVTAIRNLSLMLRTGGMIVQILGAAGYADHGFYQYSPCFFNNYYTSNGFEVLNSELEFMVSESGINPLNDDAECMAVYSQDLRMFDHSPENWARIKLNRLIHTLTKLDEVGHVYIWSVARKKETVPFNCPAQDMYCELEQRTEHKKNERKKCEREYVVDVGCLKGFFERNRQKGVAIIPAGNVCERVISCLYKNDQEDIIRIIFDNNIEKSGETIKGCKIVYPTEKKLREAEIILVCSELYEAEIYQDLIDRGVPNKKLFKLSELRRDED